MSKQTKAMISLRKINQLSLLFFLFSTVLLAQAQPGWQWTQDGNAYYRVEADEIVQYSLPDLTRKVVVTKEDLTYMGMNNLKITSFQFSIDQNKVLIYTNAKKVWRFDTKGDYWVYDLRSKRLRQLGLSQPASSLMYAKFSPEGARVAYVSENNVFVEDLIMGRIQMLTTNGKRKLINGTFDWAYEEEFSCRDGFQWSPDGQHIAFWEIDATGIPDFNMINNTDSVYSKVIPVEYPTVGHNPSSARIGVVNALTKQTVWLSIPGNPTQNYIPRIEWNSPNELLVQQLNRKQNESKIFSCDAKSGAVRLVSSEKNAAWIDIYSPWENTSALDFRHKFHWVNSGKEFLWLSEKDGWRHLYRISKEGKETLITKGDYDVMDIRLIDEKNNTVYYLASPTNATQKYLYKTKLDGTGKPEKVSPAELSGTHNYNISPNGKFAYHSFNNTFTKSVNELISLPDHKALNEKESIKSKLAAAPVEKGTEFFKVKTEDGVEMDGWMVKPKNFDPSKKYPVVFLVYTEPWGANVLDAYNVANNFLFNGSMAEEGYIYISVDNRGTPAPKGAAWRKSIYRKIGRINISDQANAAKEILKWSFVDNERIAVWGWSGGGAATLNLLFQYPDIYKTGIAIAAITNQLTYDNLYQERYMGLPQENLQDFIDGSPITYAKNLKGNLLYIHGTADDNVHYSNAEMLINELVKHNKQFQFMAYPNRTHSISEGEGTFLHLSTLYSDYLRKYCPPGGR
jgi:dipeptidyl-peptidase 4